MQAYYLQSNAAVRITMMWYFRSPSLVTPIPDTIQFLGSWPKKKPSWQSETQAAEEGSFW